MRIICPHNGDRDAIIVLRSVARLWKEAPPFNNLRRMEIVIHATAHLSGHLATRDQIGFPSSIPEEGVYGE